MYTLHLHMYIYTYSGLMYVYIIDVLHCGALVHVQTQQTA